MTYSIVARDKDTGELGVAVASHWFNTGNNVPLLAGGVGAMAIQALCAPELGPPIMALLRQGRPAAEALAAVISTDALSASRQVAVIDAKGNVAAHTGAQCIGVAGHAIGDEFSVQANIMTSDKVVPAMKATFMAAKGSLAARMMATLDAAEAAGGDLRGRQSAGLCVESADGHPALRTSLLVCDHDQPLVELKRLLTINSAYKLMNDGDSAIAAGDTAAAIDLYKRAMDIVPDNLECRYWYAVTLLNCGREDEGTKVLHELWSADSRWRDLTPRLIAAGLLTKTPKLSIR